MKYYKLVCKDLKGDLKGTLYFREGLSIDAMLNKYFDEVLNIRNNKGDYACSWPANRENGYTIGFISPEGTVHRTIYPVFINECSEEEYIENELL